MLLARLKLTASGIMLIALLSGCKIQIQVPDNGRVTTISGNYACEALQNCEIDVADLLFNEIDPTYKYNYILYQNGTITKRMMY